MKSPSSLTVQVREMNTSLVPVESVASV